MVRPLLIGNHISDSKRLQYELGMVKFCDLEEYYRITYLRDADTILSYCIADVDTLVDYAFNSEQEEQ